MIMGITLNLAVILIGALLVTIVSRRLGITFANGKSQFIYQLMHILWGSAIILVVLKTFS